MEKALIAINSIPVVDWSCYGDECEYILAENNEKNRETLKSLGIAESEIEAQTDSLSETIDISYFGFSTCKASYWHKDSGFMKLATPIEEDL